MQHRKRNQRKPLPPRTAGQYFSKSERLQGVWNRVTHVVSKMRKDGASLHYAAHEVGIDPRTVIRRGGSALRKEENGQYSAKRSDRLLRVLVVMSDEGLREVGVRDSRQATLVAEHSNAVHKYLETGDSSELRKFDRVRIRDATGAEVRLLTNLDDLNRMGSAGVLSFESIYARTA